MSSESEEVDSQQDQEQLSQDELEETEETLVSSQVAPIRSYVHVQASMEPTHRQVDYKLQPHADDCKNYDIVPYVAAIHTGHIYTVAATRCFRWVITGGDDGYVRKWDFFQSMNGKTMLTQAQKHQHVESVSKAGVLASWWENEEQQEKKSKEEEEIETKKDDEESRVPSPEPKMSPVYALDMHSEAVWAIAGMESGAIHLVTVRYDEGQTQHVFRKHNAPVSVLKITPDETGFISGSWDKTVIEWDLNNGSTIRQYDGHSSQISSVSFCPSSTLSIEHSETMTDADVSPKDPMKELFGEESDENDDNTNQMDVEVSESSGANQTKSREGSMELSKDDRNIIMTTSIDGHCFIWDRRASGKPARKLSVPDKTPPWCLSSCWSADGTKIYAGRRNGTVDEYDFTSEKHIRSFRMPANSGPVSYVTSMANGKHIICASNDNIRLWNVSLELESKSTMVPFQILPGHHGGVISQILIDVRSKYMITTSGNRGWEGGSTNACLFYEINPIV